VELLHKEISTILRMPDVTARLLDFGVIPEGDSSADFAAYIENEISKWKRMIEIGKIDKI
jgi:tripartite-type tricarboxylate transporter receptor subunit TctC